MTIIDIERTQPNCRTRTYNNSTENTDELTITYNTKKHHKHRTGNNTLNHWFTIKK